MGGQLTPAEARKKHAAAFRQFYAAYPKHVAPNEAQRVFVDLVENKGADPVQLVRAAREYASRAGDDLTYVPSPHSWLKQGRYDDADLFIDERGAEINWLRQQWTTANVKAVENRYHVTMPKEYPPDELTEGKSETEVADNIRFWYKQIAQAWITDVYRSKLECAATEPAAT